MGFKAVNSFSVFPGSSLLLLASTKETGVEAAAETGQQICVLPWELYLLTVVTVTMDHNQWVQNNRDLSFDSSGGLVASEAMNFCCCW